MPSYPKTRYWRNKKHLQNVASLACQVCGAEGQTQAAHSNMAIHGKGRGVKASDEYTAALCYPCHAELDTGSQTSRLDKQAMWREAHEKTVAELHLRGLWIVDAPKPK